MSIAKWRAKIKVLTIRSEKAKKRLSKVVTCDSRLGQS